MKRLGCTGLLRSESGQLLEAFLAAVILGIVMVVLAQILMRHAVTTAKIKQFDRSKLLADMILEQYNSRGDCLTMRTTLDVTDAEPRVLLGSNMGFDHFKVTTRTTSANPGDTA